MANYIYKKSKYFDPKYKALIQDALHAALHMNHTDKANYDHSDHIKNHTDYDPTPGDCHMTQHVDWIGNPQHEDYRSHYDKNTANFHFEL